MATSKCGQAAHGIEEIIKLIKKKTISLTLLDKFEEYLINHHKLKELDKEYLQKNQRLNQIQQNVLDLSHGTLNIVYRWIEDNSGQVKITKEGMLFELFLCCRSEGKNN